LPVRITSLLIKKLKKNLPFFQIQNHTSENLVRPKTTSSNNTELVRIA